MECRRLVHAPRAQPLASQATEYEVAAATATSAAAIDGRSDTAVAAAAARRRLDACIEWCKAAMQAAPARSEADVAPGCGATFLRLRLC